MTSSTLPDLTPEQFRAFEEAADYEYARRNFQHFLTFCKLVTRDGLVPYEAWPHFTDPRFSPQHISLDEALLSGRNIINLKARQLGATSHLIAYDIWRSQFHTQLGIQIFSLGKEAAEEVVLKAATLYHNLDVELRKPLVKNPTLTEIDWVDAGRIKAFPATEKAGRSFTSHQAFMDENAFHDWAQQNYGAVQPQAEQVVQVSTANGMANFFAEKFWSAWKAGPAGATVAVFYPWWVRPTRKGNTAADIHRMVDIHLPCSCDGQGCQKCDGRGFQINFDWYRHEEQENFPGLHEDFLAEFPGTPEEAFIARAGLVYPMFSLNTHVTPYDPWPWEKSTMRVAGVDWGGTRTPTAVVGLGLGADNRIHQFKEFYQRDVGTDPVGVWLAENGPWDAIVCDPSGEVAIQTLRAEGFPARPADNNRATGIDLQITLFETGRLSIAQRCTESIKEFPDYKWRKARDPNSKASYLTGTGGVDHHAEAMDGRRYASLEITAYEIATPSGQLTSLDGQPLATHAV